MPTRDPIEAPCRTTFHAVHDSGERDPKAIHWIVLHDEENPTAEAAARWFADVRSQGSAHICVDDARCYRTLRNEQVPWGAPGANTNGFHIEQAGFAKWSLMIWRSHRLTLRRAAFKSALHCQRFGIPVRFVTADGLRARQAGITTHRECSKAFGGDHTDPGPFWPRRLFMRYVREYAAQLGL